MSQPPPQNVSRSPKSAFNARVHAGAADLHGVDRIQSGLDQVVQQGAHAAAAVKHDFDVGQFLGTLPQAGVPRFEELAIHLGENLRSALHPQIVTEENDVDERADGGQETLQVLQMESDQPIEKLVGAGRPANNIRKPSLR